MLHAAPQGTASILAGETRDEVRKVSLAQNTFGNVEEAPERRFRRKKRGRIVLIHQLFKLL